jgi:hypothetical protein
VGPVLRLDVGLVVLLVGTATGELESLPVAAAGEVIVEKLTAAFGASALKAEGEGPARLLDLPDNALLSSAGWGPGLRPGGVEVGEDEGVSELPLRANT